MDRHAVKTLVELKAVLSSFGPDALFRGQVQQFGSDESPLMNTSFSRNGCIPPLMLKWCHYAGFTLAALLGRDRGEISVEFTQAILQHYGWRSFYLDASSEPAVAAWFASHVFNSSRSIDLCEDCFEDPVFLVKLKANYDYQDGRGFLYVLSKKALEKRNLRLVDLSSIELPECRPRFHAQHAWLVGPLYEDLPTDCVAAVIEAPRSLLLAYAVEKGFVKTDDLFPGIEDDPVLEFLASMPWHRRKLPDEKKNDIAFYSQAIELPEYHESFRKRNPPHVAFYKGASSQAARIAAGVLVFDVPESVIYGFADVTLTKFPHITEIVVGEGQHFVFEIDGLVRRPGKLTSEYLKGVAITKCADGLFAVADFSVDHPGCKVAGCGINMGWHYRIAADGTWMREITLEDCACGNNSVHLHHLSMLTIIEENLKDNPPSSGKQIAAGTANLKKRKSLYR